MSGRRYESPLREAQAQRTRELILDALVALLADRRVDEVTTREIAEAAGVSQPTVYRHFPDRLALLDGLADRIEAEAVADGDTAPDSLADLPRAARAMFAGADRNPEAATAEAVLNADPWRLSQASQRRTGELVALVDRAFPDLSVLDRRRLAGVLRALVAGTTWLRMRAEFDVDGEAAGEAVAWAVEVLLEAVGRDEFPRRAGPRPA